jgi:mRNA-degrading endonuclease RelE of RelBE toxin-antitoxin system
MKISFTVPFKKDYRNLPQSIQDQVDKQIQRLLDNPHHPSLNLKKMEGHRTIWEARVTIGYRMTFQIIEDTYALRRVGTHDILKRP